MTRTEFIEGLRELADIWESHEELPVPYVSTHWLFTTTAEEFIRYVAAFGNGKKHYADQDLEFHADTILDVKINIKRGEICERKVVGKRHVPEKIVPAYTVPAHEEEIVEWDCRPMFSKKHEIEIMKALESPQSNLIEESK